MKCPKISGRWLAAGGVVGFFTLAFVGSALLGPLAGGFIVEHFSWPWIFYVNVPFAIIAANRYFEVQKYMSNTGHFFDFITIVAHRKTFEALPPAQQKAIRDGMDAAVRYQRERAKLQETDSIVTIRQRGVQYDEVSPKLIADMRTATAGIVDDVRKRAGDDLVRRVLAEAAKK